MKSVHIQAQGLVQGVFFCLHTLENAKGLSVNGFVRNLTDNAVEIEAQGEVEAMGKFISQCLPGPDIPKVT